MSTPLSRTTAKRQAHRESYMYQQGRGYIVSVWNDITRCNWTSDALPLSVARQALSDWRALRVRELMAMGSKQFRLS